jgi:hypothetical protein
MINIKSVIIYFIFVIVFQVFSSCKDKPLGFNGQVYKLDNNNYGYSIFLNNKLIIKQDNIPTVEGNVSFKDSIDALKTMDLVIKKLNSKSNPSLTKEEIQKLNLKR